MFRPTSTNSKSPSSSPRLNVRMDDLQDTVTQYGEQLLLLNRKLEEAKDKKAYLQSKLVKEQKKTTELRLQLDALKMTALEFEERERCRNAIAMNLGSQMEKAKILLEEKKQEATNLRSLIQSKICNIESSSCDIQMKFKNLKLRDIDAEPQEDTSFPNEEEIKHLEKEISCLQKELNSVQTGNDFHVPCEELKWLVSETEKNLCMDKQKICVEQDNVRQLEDDLQALQKNVGELEEDL